MIRRQRRGDKVRVTFVLPDTAEYGRISVVGDFNKWTPDVHRLVRRGQRHPQRGGDRPRRIRAPIPLPGRGPGVAVLIDDPDADGRVDQDGGGAGLAFAIRRSREDRACPTSPRLLRDLRSRRRGGAVSQLPRAGSSAPAGNRHRSR
jgi:hypothetical protein